jgi:hypothetical protein
MTTQRLDFYKASPEAMRALVAFDMAVARLGVDDAGWSSAGRRGGRGSGGGSRCCSLRPMHRQGIGLPALLADSSACRASAMLAGRRSEKRS